MSMRTEEIWRVWNCQRFYKSWEITPEGSQEILLSLEENPQTPTGKVNNVYKTSVLRILKTHKNHSYKI